MNDQERIDALEKRMGDLEQCLTDWRSDLSDNTSATLRVESNTMELVELLTMAKTGISFFAGVGRVLRRIVVWIGPFLAAAAAIWGFMHGKLPGKP
ncbi:MULTISPECIES: hypothetical protein [unclassified Burkholderia]|uniref:hypothetical protein n=1 Tax=unclassified Burkholderia TaxID=2613784 RepID=UPI000F55FE96|nr:MULTISPECIES: hypothetical protein [unclassified Burkholderia]RQS29393.1 hypothetical protein DIE05_13380 [Burkholderia sp. Bp8995]RQS47639.1 hypothetical protein DIE00_13960 [Burkholderia sp. Bp8989]